MATKPILPEVQAERARAAEDYRRAQQAAIDRIARLRAARLEREAQLGNQLGKQLGKQSASQKR
jgi:hypothetical protein